MIPDAMRVREAREIHMRENGFTVEGYTAKSVTIKYFGREFQFPNPPSRQVAVPYHDLHHMATGYATDPKGEAEISAWELFTGGKLSLFVRSILVSGALMGLFIAPVRTIRAAWRARGTRNFYATQPPLDELLDLTMGELRARLRLVAYAAPPCPRESSTSSPRRSETSPI